MPPPSLVAVFVLLVATALAQSPSPSPTPAWNIRYNGELQVSIVCVGVIVDTTTAAIICDHADPIRYNKTGGLGGPESLIGKRILAHKFSVVNATKIVVGGGGDGAICFAIAAPTSAVCGCYSFDDKLPFFDARCNSTYGAYNVRVATHNASGLVGFALQLHSPTNESNLVGGLFLCMNFVHGSQSTQFFLPDPGASKSNYKQNLAIRFVERSSELGLCFGYSSSLRSSLQCIAVTDGRVFYGPFDSGIDGSVHVVVSASSEKAALFGPTAATQTTLFLLDSGSSSEYNVSTSTGLDSLAGIFSPDGMYFAVAFGSKEGYRSAGCMKLDLPITWSVIVSDYNITYDSDVQISVNSDTYCVAFSSLNGRSVICGSVSFNSSYGNLTMPGAVGGAVRLLSSPVSLRLALVAADTSTQYSISSFYTAFQTSTFSYNTPGIATAVGGVMLADSSKDTVPVISFNDLSDSFANVLSFPSYVHRISKTANCAGFALMPPPTRLRRLIQSQSLCPIQPYYGLFLPLASTLVGFTTSPHLHTIRSLLLLRLLLFLLPYQPSTLPSYTRRSMLALPSFFQMALAWCVIE